MTDNGANGYADSLCLFIKNELIPYISSKDRTIDLSIAVGHSSDLPICDKRVGKA